MKYYLFYILEWGQFSVKMGTPYNLAYCSKSGNIHIRSILKNSCWDFFWCRFTHLNLSTHKIHIKTVFLSLTDLLLLDEHLCMFVCAHIHAYTQFNAEFASILSPSNNDKGRDYNCTIKIQFKHHICYYHVSFYIYIHTFCRKEVYTLNIDNLVRY